MVLVGEQGTLYLEDYATPEALASKANLAPDHKLFSYYGYAFESFATTAQKPSETQAGHPLPPGEQSNGWSGDVNTNVQWCSVVKTNLGGFRMLLGGEVDCVLERPGMTAPRTSDLVELKTSMVIQSPKDEVKFEKFVTLAFG